MCLLETKKSIMDNLNDKEISKMDDILKFLCNHNDNCIDRKYIEEKLDINYDEYEFLEKKIIEFSREKLSIGKIMDEHTAFESLNCDFSTKRFIDNGGFKNYFTDDTIKEKTLSTQTINIAGNVINGNINHSDLRIDSSTNKKQKNYTPKSLNKKSVLKKWFLKYWWYVVIPIGIGICVGIIVLYIEHKYF